MTSFAEKWKAAQSQSHLVVGLAPRLPALPAPIARHDDPFLPFGRAIIEATAEHACAFAFDLASYLALGAAGAIALERTIPLVPRHLPVILHAPFFTPDFAAAAFDSPFAVDAVTLASGHIEVVSAYVKAARHGAFVLEHAAMIMGLEHKANVGFYDAEGFELGGQAARWVIDPIIYASGKADFAETARAAADHFRQISLKKI